MSTDNASIVREFIERVFNEGRMASLTDLVHPHYAYRSSAHALEGRAALQEMIESFHLAFPDLRLAILQQVGEDEDVCTRFELTGTHRGEFMGAPATGRSIRVEGVVISRVIAGRISEEWELLDEARLLAQLGLDQAVPEAA